MVSTMVDTACHGSRFIVAGLSMVVETATKMSLTENLLRRAG